MKKFSILFALFALLCEGMTSCSKDNTEDPPTDRPTVTLKAGTVTDVSTVFTIQAHDAERCAYLCIEQSGEEAPTAPSPETIFNNGKEVAVESPVEITLSNLTPGQNYCIYAVAVNTTIYSDIAELKFTTMSSTEPEYDLLIEGTSALGGYYKSFTDETLGNYMIRVSNIEYDDYGYATNAGYAFQFDLYGTKSANVMNAQVPSGIYRFDTEDTGAEFTCGAGYSKIEQTDDQGYPKGEAISLTAGEIRIDTSEDNYTITAYVTDEQGTRYKVSYTGRMVLSNKTGSIGGNQEIENANLFYARYYGQADHNGIGNYYVSIGTTTVDKDDPTTALDNGWMIRLDFWGDVSADDDNAILPEGTYTLSESGAHNKMTICPDDTDVAYYFLTGKTPERTDYTCSSGSVTVTRTGSDYKLEGTLVMDDESSVHFTYEGPLAFENRAEALIGNIDETFTVASCTYLGDQYTENAESDSYQIRLATDESESTFVNIELFTEKAASALNPVIPDGSYNAGNQGSYEAGTFTPGYLFSGYLAGSNIGKKDEYGSILTYGLFTGGTIDFAYANGRYTITLDVTTSDNFSIKGSYSGELPIDNKVVGPAIGNVNFTALYAPSAYYYGKKNDGLGDYYYYLLSFSDIEMAGSYNGIYPVNQEAGHCAVLYVYAATEPGADGRVPEGEYTLGEERKGLIWSTGSEGRAYDAEGNRSNVAFGSGTLNIAHQGTNEYVITLDAKTLREETFKFTYTGAITIGGTSTAAVTPTVTKIPSSVIPMMYEAMKRDAVVVRDLSASKAETILALPDQAPAQRLHKELASKR